MRLHGNAYLSADCPRDLPDGVISVELNSEHREMLSHWLDQSSKAILSRAYRYAHNPQTGSMLPANLIKQLRCVVAATLNKKDKSDAEFYLHLSGADKPPAEQAKREPIRLKKRTGGARMYIMGLTGGGQPERIPGKE